MAEVRIRDLEKTSGAVPVVHGVRVDGPDGEFVVLIGPSGCGTSTLLRMIAGLKGISSGTILIADRAANNLPPTERDIAMVFQNYALCPHKTVVANMSFALKMARISKVNIDARVERAADVRGVKPCPDRYSRAVSRGQRQRVAIRRAIVRNRHMFLFDEPLSNRDAKLRVQMRAEIRELHQRLGTMTVHVTHDQIEAMTMADRIVMMRDGRIAQIGAPLDLYDNPANVFVARFIGSPAMNLFEGVVAQDGRFAGAGVVFDMQRRVEPGRKVTLGICPEHRLLTATGLPATVVVVEPAGSEIHLVLRAGDQKMTALIRGRRRFTPGQSLHVTPEAGMSHLFDTATGERL